MATHTNSCLYIANITNIDDCAMLALPRKTLHNTVGFLRCTGERRTPVGSMAKAKPAKPCEKLPQPDGHGAGSTTNEPLTRAGLTGSETMMNDDDDNNFSLEG